MTAPVRAALGGLRAFGPRANSLADFLSCDSKRFIAANEEIFASFPLVVKRGGPKGYGLTCGPRPVRAGEEVLRVPPAVWLPYCAEAAVRKAEGGAPDFLARLSNACAKIGGGDASRMAPVACLALELLFTLERNAKEPYLGLLWEASRSDSSMPHPLLMGPEHLEFLQASPLRDSIAASSRIYSTLHRSIFGLGMHDDALSSGDELSAESQPSASSTRHFLWALGVILSRGVSEDGAGGTGLVPYLDFANHGDASPRVGGTGGVGRGGASCERGFDEATGCHFLRASRDIAPGEELLIDYGSTSKPMYRFARTYGFINFSCCDASGTISSEDGNPIDGSCGGDTSGSIATNGDDWKDGRLHGQNRHRGGSDSGTGTASSTDSLRVRVDSPPATTRMLDLPVRLADVREVLDLNSGVAPSAAAPFSSSSRVRPVVEPTGTAASPSSPSSPPPGTMPSSSSSSSLAAAAAAAGAAAGPMAASGEEAGAEAGKCLEDAEVKAALRDRLRRYSTNLQEDLDFLLLLRRGRRAYVPPPVPAVPPGMNGKAATPAPGGERDVHHHHHHPHPHIHPEEKGGEGPPPPLGQPAAVSTRVGGKVTAEWVEMCVALRAAEKLALERMLRAGVEPAAVPVPRQK